MMKETMTGTKGVSSAAPERKEGERSEPNWSEGAAASAQYPPEGPCAPVRLAEAPNPEVAEKPVRRRFTAEYKRAIRWLGSGLAMPHRFDSSPRAVRAHLLCPHSFSVLSAFSVVSPEGPILAWIPAPGRGPWQACGGDDGKGEGCGAASASGPSCSGERSHER